MASWEEHKIMSKNCKDKEIVKNQAQIVNALSLKPGTPIVFNKRSCKYTEKQTAKIKGKKNPLLVAARRVALTKMVGYLEQHKQEIVTI